MRQPAGRIGITGGSGFIGSCVADRMTTAGSDVVVLDMRPPQQSDVAYRHVDVLGSCRSWSRRRVISTPCSISPGCPMPATPGRPVSAVQVNVAGTANVFEASRRNDVRRTVLAGTAWSTPVRTVTCRSTRRRRFISRAGAHRHVVEDHRRAHRGQLPRALRHPVHDLALRRRERAGHVGELRDPRFVRQALEGKTNTVNGDGSQFRNDVYVDDLVDAHLAAPSGDAENEVFNLKGPEPITIRRIAEEVRELLGAPFTIDVVAHRATTKAGSSPAKRPSARRWKPDTFPDGLRRYVDWYPRTTSPETHCSFVERLSNHPAGAMPSPELLRMVTSAGRAQIPPVEGVEKWLNHRCSSTPRVDDIPDAESDYEAASTSMRRRPSGLSMPR